LSNESDLILIGAGGHARACIDVIEKQARYNIVGLVGLPEELLTRPLGYTVFGSDGDLVTLREKFLNVLITIGQIKTSRHRKRLYEQVLELGFSLPTIISPTAYVSRHAVLGAGTIVMHGAVVNAGARVGMNCIVNTNALLEHDTAVGDHCHVSTGTILNGGVRVGSGTFIGSGSLIKEGVKIGEDCTIGMGSKIRNDLPDRTNVKHHD
jgi:sugar O-acyltransferase (sialic acid O-acetyltransferase NeuD family)